MSCGRIFLVWAILVYVNCVTPFGVAITDKSALTIDCISHHGTLNYDMTLDLASVLLQK